MITAYHSFDYYQGETPGELPGKRLYKEKHRLGDNVMMSVCALQIWPHVMHSFYPPPSSPVFLSSHKIQQRDSPLPAAEFPSCSLCLCGSVQGERRAEMDELVISGRSYHKVSKHPPDLFRTSETHLVDTHPAVRTDSYVHRALLLNPMTYDWVHVTLSACHHGEGRSRRIKNLSPPPWKKSLNGVLTSRIILLFCP